MEGGRGTSVNKGRPMKNVGNKSKIIRKKKRFDLVTKIPGLVNYLKFDSYLYTPVISPSLPPRQDVNLPSIGWERNKPLLKSDDKFKEKLVQYLKSDAYLYAPLQDTSHREDAAVKNVISLPQAFCKQENQKTAQELPFTRVTRTVLSKKIAWQTKQVSQDSVVDEHGDLGMGVSPAVADMSPKTPGVPEVKRQATRRRGRQSTVSGG